MTIDSLIKLLTELSSSLPAKGETEVFIEDRSSGERDGVSPKADKHWLQDEDGEWTDETIPCVVLEIVPLWDGSDYIGP